MTDEQINEAIVAAYRMATASESRMEQVLPYVEPLIRALNLLRYGPDVDADRRRVAGVLGVPPELMAAPLDVLVEWLESHGAE